MSIDVGVLMDTEVTHTCPRCQGTYPALEFRYRLRRPYLCKPCGRLEKVSRYVVEQPEIPEIFELTLDTMVSPTGRQAAKRRRYFRLTVGMSIEDKRTSTEYRLAIKNDPCKYCGEVLDELEVDHFFPLAHGGTDHWYNLVASCRECNNIKGVMCGTKMILKMGAARV